MRIVGFANLFFATVGLFQLFANVIGYVRLPASFVDQYGPFMRHRFSSMSVATAVFLVPLACLGIGLVRCKPGSILPSNIVFGAELVYFVGLLGTWDFAIAPLTSIVVRLGLFNIGLVLQVITAYPILAIILLNHERLWNRRVRTPEQG